MVLVSFAVFPNVACRTCGGVGGGFQINDNYTRSWYNQLGAEDQKKFQTIIERKLEPMTGKWAKGSPEYQKEFDTKIQTLGKKYIQRPSGLGGDYYSLPKKGATPKVTETYEPRLGSVPSSKRNSTAGRSETIAGGDAAQEQVLANQIARRTNYNGDQAAKTVVESENGSVKDRMRRFQGLTNSDNSNSPNGGGLRPNSPAQDLTSLQSKLAGSVPAMEVRSISSASETEPELLKGIGKQQKAPKSPTNRNKPTVTRETREGPNGVVTGLLG
jgi:hypothetical protein